MRKEERRRQKEDKKQADQKKSRANHVKKRRKSAYLRDRGQSCQPIDRRHCFWFASKEKGERADEEDDALSGEDFLCAEKREEENKSRSERGGGEMEAAHIYKDKKGK